MTNPTIYTPEEVKRFAREERWGIRLQVAMIVAAWFLRAFERAILGYFVAWGAFTLVLIVNAGPDASVYEATRSALAFAQLGGVMAGLLAAWRGRWRVELIDAAQANRVWS